MSILPDSVLSVIGRPQARVDGPLKVSGSATYTSDVDLPDLLIAVPVCSTIASGRLVSLDIAGADAMPGVHAVLHRDNIGRFYRLSGNSMETATKSRRTTCATNSRPTTSPRSRASAAIRIVRSAQRRRRSTQPT
jgi:CO/xanthine dehydrogenase Mo-binding subunit